MKPVRHPLPPLLPAALAILLAGCNRSAPEALDFKVVSSRPHDPDSFTQGLEFHGDRLFESSGRYGISNIRETDPATGKVLRKRPMGRQLFTEGITILNNELWALSWKEHLVHVIDPETFRFIRTHNYEGEGWGLTNDGRQLIMSDGTSNLRFIDPSNFTVQRTMEVTRDGRPVDKLNELEWVDGQIFANIYMTGTIVRISPDDGRVTGFLDLSALRNQLPRPHNAEAFNGIARNPSSGRLFVTGKLWPRMFEIDVFPKG